MFKNKIIFYVKKISLKKAENFMETESTETQNILKNYFDRYSSINDI